MSGKCTILSYALGEWMVGNPYVRYNNCKITEVRYLDMRIDPSTPRMIALFPENKKRFNLSPGEFRNSEIDNFCSQQQHMALLLKIALPNGKSEDIVFDPSAAQFNGFPVFQTFRNYLKITNVKIHRIQEVYEGKFPSTDDKIYELLVYLFREQLPQRGTSLKQVAIARETARETARMMSELGIKNAENIHITFI
ncbi:hypothetical protein DFS34DRAFT_589016 [Phlyctochytrium arcticum]|nr:hypothetical protein DFS34DRAFT_589016 [Phlyctochytrium arcticum]